jgi:phenylacetate-CoA ligase
MGRVDQATKVRGLFIHPGQVDEVASRYPQVEKYQMVIKRREDKDEMILRIELKEEAPQSEKLKQEIEQSIRDVMKVRGDIQLIPKGTIPEGAKKIEDERKWE